MEVNNQFEKMAGTDGSGQYIVLAVCSAGRLGVRSLDNDEWRIRLEPSKECYVPPFIFILDDWKCPELNNLRFSYHVHNVVDLAIKLRIGYQLLWKLDRDGMVLQTKVDPPLRKIVRSWLPKEKRLSVEEVVTSFASDLRAHAKY